MAGGVCRGERGAFKMVELVCVMTGRGQSLGTALGRRAEMPAEPKWKPGRVACPPAVHLTVAAGTGPAPRRALGQSRVQSELAAAHPAPRTPEGSRRGRGVVWLLQALPHVPFEP